MSVTDILKSILNSPSVLGEIYKDLASPSFKVIGEALGTVFEYGTNFLLPLKLKREKMRETFTHNMDVFKKKYESIPKKDRREVRPYIGAPIVDKLTYATDKEIVDMYTTLLASDSNIQTRQFVHHSFVSIIENLCPDEARIIEHLKGKDTIEFCSIRGRSKTSSGFTTLKDHVTNIASDAGIDYPDNEGAYLSNLVRLGFLFEPQGVPLKDKTGYDRIRERIDYETMKSEKVPSEYKSLECKEGYYVITPFAKLFLDAVFPKIDSK